jgi:nucleoside-diphosphate-sugar epimerase
MRPKRVGCKRRARRVDDVFSLGARKFTTMREDSFVSVRKAKRVLGFAPKHSDQNDLIRNYRRYLEHLREFEGASDISHRVPWKQILRLVKVFF